MRLHDLKPSPGSKHRRKRLGQGESSGHGKCSGRGGKGQSARSGSSIRPGFEGGQMPLIRRIPKRGFNNISFRYNYAEINVSALNVFDNGAKVDETALVAVNLIHRAVEGVKILGDGEITKKLSVVANGFTASARKKIEAAGGTCEVVMPFKPEPKAEKAKAQVKKTKAVAK
jgi:large subunit ribosomal protein L15